MHAIDELASSAAAEEAVPAQPPATEPVAVPAPRRVTRARSKVRPSPRPGLASYTQLLLSPMPCSVVESVRLATHVL